MKLENVWMILPDRTVGFGTLETEGSHISAIALADGFVPGPRGAAQPIPCVSSLPPRLVLPGLVNCHGHTAMTLVRGLGGGLPLKRWLEEAIFPVEAKMTPEDVRAGTLWGAMEMLAGGTTTVADMYDFPSAGEEAFAEAGINAHVNRVGLSFVPGRLDECVAFAKAHPASHLCIHSEYLTDEAFCRGLAAANRELRRPVHFHVSETKREHEECLARHGRTPVAYLADTGLLDHGGYAAHGVWCTDDDFRTLAAKGVSLVHNPTSNMKLGSGFARIARARELGVNVALGTDGCASNDNLDMFEEMHLAALIHKGLSQDPTVLPAWDVIEMATVNGAKALGRDDIGSLAVGKRADFAVVDLKGPHLAPCLDAANLIVYAMHASDVVKTVVGGVLVYDAAAPDPFLGRVDVAAARARFRAAVGRLGLCAFS